MISSRAFFGAADGADGLSFALQNQGSNLVGGGATGFGVNLSSAFGIEFDTHYNAVHNNNINSDFSQFFKQGQTSNQGTAFDAPRAHDNLEDGTWRDLVITWNAATKTLGYSLDGVFISSIVYDVVAADWGGNANGFFGFGAGTGGSNNQQQVEIVSIQTGGSTTIAENSAAGTVVGVATAVDPDRTGTVTYSLTDNAGGRFAINSSTGQITVASGAVLDFEVNTSHRIVVQSTDQGSQSFSKTLTINVSNVNEAPVDISTATQSISITNPSFEANVFADGAAGYVASGWTVTGTAGTFNPSTSAFTSGNGTNGSQIGFADQSSSLAQTLSTNFDSSLNYRLSVDVGRRIDYGNIANYSVQLFAGATLIGSYTNFSADPGVWGTVNVDVAGTSFSGANGQALRIVLSNLTSTTSQIQFDNLSLISSSATASIAENSANNAVVTTVTGLDRDAGNMFTYSLTNNAGGRFAINSSTGQITVANGSLLDFETSSSHTVVVQAADQGGLTFSRTMTIAVTNVNEAPTALALTGATTGAGSSASYNATLDSYYALVSTNYTWEAAMDNAQASFLGGVSGTLVNINSSTEQTTLQACLEQALLGSAEKTPRMMVCGAGLTAIRPDHNSGVVATRDRWFRGLIPTGTRVNQTAAPVNTILCLITMALGTMPAPK